MILDFYIFLPLWTYFKVLLYLHIVSKKSNKRFCFINNKSFLENQIVVQLSTSTNKINTSQQLYLLLLHEIHSFKFNYKVTRFCTWEPYTNKEDAINFINTKVIPHPWFRAICLNGQPIGAILVTKNSDNDKCRGELGYVLGSKY